LWLICGNVEHHEYQLYLAIEDIDHTRTKTKSPQTNGICERFHRTILEEFYQIALRKKLYTRVEQLQQDVDDWIDSETAPDRIQAVTATARLRCKPSSIASPWSKRRCCINPLRIRWGMKAKRGSNT
jgi:transposase InsO family protein